MNLGIQGRRAIVCGASMGLGKACAEALAVEDVHLIINARSKGRLDQTAEQIRKQTGVHVIAVAADITTEHGRDAVIEACPNPDILINNAGGPPAGDFRNWSRADWLDAIEANMLTPISLVKSTIDGMTERQFGRIVNITTVGVKSAGNYPRLGLSIGARSGLTGFMGTLARQVAGFNVTINALLPGRFDTERYQVVTRDQAQSEARTYQEIVADQLESIPARRLGIDEEFGALCAYLCSVKAAYITGQNIVIDGGAFTGSL